MRGDFSRIRFNPARQYTAVLEQQGRVAVDADANEQSAIEAHIRDITNIDVIGRYGAPEDDAGFAIAVAAGQIRFGHGRYYVEGLLVENNAVGDYDAQPYLYNPTYTAAQLLDAVQSGKGNVTAHIFLQVFQRLVTQLDDPCLREPALGQADTTARLQTVWRVIGTLEDTSSTTTGGTGTTSTGATGITTSTGGTLTLLEAVRAGTGINKVNPTLNLTGPGRTISTGPIKVSTGGGTGTINTGGSTGTISTGTGVGTIVGGPKLSGDNPINRLSPCCQSLYETGLHQRTGAMKADTSGGNTDCGCQPIASAGYQGLENQLYRVEIHTSGDINTATFKWSRENGSVVTAITAINGPVVTVSGLGPDVNLGFQPGQWVELTDDTYIFGDPPNQPGGLYQIQSLGPGPLQVTLTASVSGVVPALNARMRRWDQSGAAATSAGVPLAALPIQLENGIEVTFRKGEYAAGDYWTIPARAATGAIEWPPCGGDGNAFQPPAFITVYNAPLACIHLRPPSNLLIKFSSPFLVDDCRLTFPPLTALTAQLAPPALHVSTISWANDDVMTVDTLLEKGLSVTLDQPPTCPWGGGNFQVTFEAPFAADNTFAAILKRSSAFGALSPTDIFLRTVAALDSPLGITVTGSQVIWLAPVTLGSAAKSAVFLWEVLNLLLGVNQNPGPYARVRVRLHGDAVYASSASGNIYLDGIAFGDTAQRADASQCVTLLAPSGNFVKASDFDSWFYLAPTLLITSVVIQATQNGVLRTLSAVTVDVDFNGQMTGLEGTGTPAKVVVTGVQAVIQVNYPAIASTPISLSLVGPGVGSVVSIPATATVPAGKTSVTVPITIQASPGVNPNGAGNTDTVTLNASIATAVGNQSFATPPTLAITGGPIPPPVIG